MPISNTAQTPTSSPPWSQSGGNGRVSPTDGHSSPPLVQDKVHNVRKELKLDANERWNEALKRMRNDAGYNAAVDGKNDARSRWSRAVLYAHDLASADNSGKISSDEEDSSDSGNEEEDGAWLKHLEEMHYLEMIDPKHRYGSNLKYYHRKWQEEDTTDNFFKWLDRGDGKDLSLPECPRQHLENATIRYLTPEQRYHYLVLIDKEGRLRWAHNNEYVDSTPGRWEDVGEGRGVVSVDSSEISSPIEPSTPPSIASPVPSSPMLDEGPGEIIDEQKASIAKKVSDHFTGSLTEGLLRRTLRKVMHQQTWIYVSSLHYDLYIGIKNTGSFQHSSFLAGGLITSAGSIVVKDGLIQSISPLSGHYRTSIEHFKAFVQQMEKRGADLSKVSISKAVATLWGMQQTRKVKRLKSSLAHMPKAGILSLAHAMHMTPIHRERPTSPRETETDDELAAMLKRRELLYGRPPSDKANKSLESVQETDEPEEPAHVKPAFCH